MAGLFAHNCRWGSIVDIGKRRSANQDVVVCCPEYNFFAVSDGMGGLAAGGETSDMIRQALPGMIAGAAQELGSEGPARAAELLLEQVSMISDSIYDIGNRDGSFRFGATLCACWLVGDSAVFVNLGDSRGYLLPRYKKNMRRVTSDHNVAEILVEQGELTEEEADRHPARSRLTRFVGNKPPAIPETFIEKLRPGDRILLCSDGLHGMVKKSAMRRILRSSRSPSAVCSRLAQEANANGGADNISAVYVWIRK